MVVPYLWWRAIVKCTTHAEDGDAYGVGVGDYCGVSCGVSVGDVKGVKKEQLQPIIIPPPPPIPQYPPPSMQIIKLSKSQLPI